MSELFTQNYSDKPLFHTDTDLSESLHNQVDEASNGEELLDNTEKQAESLLSNDDYVNPNHVFSKWACESCYLFLSVIEVFRPALSDNLHLFLT